MSIVPTKRAKRNFVVSLLILLAVLAVFCGAVYYLNDLRGDIKSKEVELESEKLFSSGLQGVRASLQTAAGDIESFDSFFVDNEDIIGFLDRLEELARTRGVEVNLNFRSEAIPVEDERTRLERLDIQLRTTADLDATMDYYQDLVTEDEFIQINDLAISRSIETNFDDADVNSSAIDASNEWTSEAKITIYRTVE